VLVVEDDREIRSLLQTALGVEGFAVRSAASLHEALALLEHDPPDAIVLDLGLPTLDGLQMLQRLRDGAATTPVLVVTARGSTEDKVTGLNLGADDYLGKPFDLDELQARLNALLRRSVGEEELTCGMLRLDRKSGIFYNDMRPLDLSPREAALLKALLRKRGQVVPRDALREAVFGSDAEASSDAIEVLVHRLRKRLAGSCAEVMTLRGVGYLLIDEAIAGKDD